MLLTGGVGDSVSLYLQATVAQYGPPPHEITHACLGHLLNSSAHGGPPGSAGSSAWGGTAAGGETSGNNRPAAGVQGEGRGPPSPRALQSTREPGLLEEASAGGTAEAASPLLLPGPVVPAAGGWPLRPGCGTGDARLWRWPVSVDRQHPHDTGRCSSLAVSTACCTTACIVLLICFRAPPCYSKLRLDGNGCISSR